jgi:hypothetical protein
MATFPVDFHQPNGKTDPIILVYVVLSGDTNPRNIEKLDSRGSF